jgi:purine-nucleoside phosphorylase
VYVKRYRELLLASARRLDLRVMEGVYAFTGGPVYETPAEIRAYGHMGADIVGMSTVPEAVFAKACGMRVAGLSLVSNYAAGISSEPLTHDEVIAASNAAKPIMAKLLDSFVLSL